MKLTDIKLETNGSISSFTMTPLLLDYFFENDYHFGNKNNVRNTIGRRFQFVNTVKIGKFSITKIGSEIVDIGSYSYARSLLTRGIKIGNYCSIAQNLSIMGVNHPIERFSTSSFTYDGGFSIFSEDAPSLEGRFVPRANPKGKASRPTIENDVWIGERVLLSNSINIGTGSVVAAGSIVTKDVEPYAIVGGNPARVIRMRFPSEICQRLIQSEWYKFQFPHFKGIDVSDDIETNVSKIEDLIKNSDTPKIKPAIKMSQILFDFVKDNPA